MSEKLGVEKLKSVAGSAARILNAVSGLIHKQGLVVLLSVIGDIQDLAKTDWVAVKAEVLDLSAPESDEVEAAFKAELKLLNPAVQLKVSDGIDCVQAAAAVVAHELAVVEEAKAVVEKVKLLLA